MKAGTCVKSMEPRRARAIGRLIVAGLSLAAQFSARLSAAPLDVSAQENNTGDDFDKPPPNLFQLLNEYRTSTGQGATPGSTTEVDTNILKFRLDHRIDLPSQWTLALRSDLPLQAKNPVSLQNPNGDYLYGLGDASVQAALIHDLSDRWTFGAGARLIAPTGDATIASGKWQIMPGFALRYSLPEISPASYLEPLVRYDVSFAGDPLKRNISNLQFAPTFSIALPDRWFATLYPNPDIRVNFGDSLTGQTGRLFLPFDAQVGRKLSDATVISLEIGLPIIRDYPVYNFKSALRFNLTF